MTRQELKQNIDAVVAFSHDRGTPEVIDVKINTYNIGPVMIIIGWENEVFKFYNRDNQIIGERKFKEIIDLEELETTAYQLCDKQEEH